MIDIWLFLGFLALNAFVLSTLGTKMLIKFLTKKQIVDVPNQRSFHTKATPRGAGMVLVPIVLVSWVGLGFYFDIPNGFLWGVPFASILLLVISALDDIKTIGPLPRFGVQILACLIGIYFLDVTYVFQGYLPFWLDRVLAFLALLWFTNLYNFMDGVDGITGVETASITLSLASIMLLQGFGDVFFPAINAVIFGAALGFLVWNWAPSKILIGDSGSVSFGFILGWMLLFTAGNGYFWAAGLIALYHCMDATTTIIGRITRGEKIWEPHRLHFFHRPVPHAYNHAQIVLRIMSLNILLFACAHWTAMNADFLWQLPAILLAVGSTTALLVHFYGKRIR